MLVVAAFVVAAFWPGLQSGNSESLDAVAYTEEAIAGMSANLTYDEAEAIAQAEADLALAKQQARANLATATSAGQQVVDGVDLPRTLPAAPDGYVPGADVADWVAAPEVAPFTVPPLPGELSPEEFAELGWTDVASPEHRESTLQLEALEQQLATLRQQLDGLDNGEADLVWALLESQGLPSGRDQQVPDETPDDPEGTVEPDAEGAHLAAAHAEQVLGVAEDQLTTFESDLERIDQIHLDLVATVDHVMAVTPSLQNETQLRLADQLIGRLGALDAQLESTRNTVEAQLAAHKGWAEKARVDATKDIDALAMAEADRIRQVGQTEAAHLRGEAAVVQAEADEALAQTEALTSQAIKDLLAAQKASGDDLGTQIDLVKAHGTAVAAQIVATSQQKQSMLLAAADRIEADAEADAARIVAAGTEAKRHLEGQIDDRLESARTAADFALARAEYLTEAKKEATEQLHDDTLERFMIDSEANVEYIKKTAWDINQASKDVLVGTDELVLRIEEDVQELVVGDVEYVLKVVEDYREVPTPEREAAAAELERIASQLGIELEDTVAGADADGTTSQLLRTVQDLQAHVQSVEDDLRSRGADLAQV